MTVVADCELKVERGVCEDYDLVLVELRKILVEAAAC